MQVGPNSCVLTAYCGGHMTPCNGMNGSPALRPQDIGYEFGHARLSCTDSKRLQLALHFLNDFRQFNTEVLSETLPEVGVAHF